MALHCFNCFKLNLIIDYVIKVRLKITRFIFDSACKSHIVIIRVIPLLYTLWYALAEFEYEMLFYTMEKRVISPCFLPLFSPIHIVIRLIQILLTSFKLSPASEVTIARRSDGSWLVSTSHIQIRHVDRAPRTPPTSRVSLRESFGPANQAPFFLIGT